MNSVKRLLDIVGRFATMCTPVDIPVRLLYYAMTRWHEVWFCLDPTEEYCVLQLADGQWKLVDHISTAVGS